MSSHPITICEGTDVICDCIIDILGIQAVAAHWRCTPGVSCGARYDTNGDDRVDVVDIMLVAARWGCGCGDECYGAESPTVSLEPAESTVTAGDVFSVDVVLHDARDLGAYQVSMYFDPIVVEMAMGSWPSLRSRLRE